MKTEKPLVTPDLTPYHPYGIPMLKFLSTIAILPLLATLVYHYFF